MLADDSIILNTPTLGVIGLLVSGLVGALVFMFKLYIKSRDAEAAELREQRESYKKGYDRSVAMLEAVADQRKIEAGGVPIPKVAKPASEHNSPTSERQKFSSEIETLKARELAAKLSLEAATAPPPDPVKVMEISPEAAKAISDAAKDVQ